jgi:hypothetical protein
MACLLRQSGALLASTLAVSVDTGRSKLTGRHCVMGSRFGFQPDAMVRKGDAMDSSGHPVKPQQADSLATRNRAKPRGMAVVYSCKAYGNPCSHESMTQSEMARKLAAIKDYDFAGEFDASCRYDGPLYFVPDNTLVAIDFAHRLGIHGEQDLFGGVVPFPFVATKTITHSLFDADSHAPDGWSPGFARRVHDAVLPGFSAFALRDARSAGAHLLEQGTVRIKKASGIGGLGQSVVNDADELEAWLQSFDAEELSRDGLVVEQNLTNVATHSVGRVRVGELLATYHGMQRLTVNNHGNEVYGGSDLTVVRGNFDALLRLGLGQEMRTAIAQARTYHDAAMASFPGMFASRCNYDVAQGFDDEGRWYSGVLEQSWRIGGATGAEIAALDAFRADPALGVVRASTTEIYGSNPILPADAVVYFRGIDKNVGPLTKYSRLKSYGNP